MTEMIENLINNATVAASAGDWEKAIQDLEQVIQIQGNHIGALNGIGICLMNFGQFQEAVPYFRKVSILSPDSTDALNNLGSAYNMSGDIQAAEDSFKRVLSIDPDNLVAYKNLVLVYLQNSERFEEAVQVLSALVQVNPDDPELLFLLGTCYEQAGSYSSAYSLYEKAAQLAPENSDFNKAFERVKEIQQSTASPESKLKKLSSLKELREKKTDKPESLIKIGNFDVNIAADWVMFSSCNYNCRYCYIPQNLRFQPVPELPDISQLADFFDKSGLIWYIILTGGEPFLFKNFTELCQLLTKKHYIRINSNFALPVVDRFIQSVSPDHVSHIHCSLHLEQREQRKQVEDLIKRLKTAEDKGFRIVTSYVFHPMFLNRLESDFEYFLSRGVIVIPKFYNGTYQGRFFPQQYSFEEKRTFINVAKKAKDLWLERYSDNPFLPPNDIFEDSDYIENGIPDYRGQMCSAGSRFITIRDNGDIFRCGEQEILGNIYNNSFTRPKNASPCKSSYCQYFCKNFLCS